ncbi:hypothetical protein RFM23_21070 [Mesorhizobium abyssinicae]|uniref:Replication protein n=1 Tax=Mesorhizobium abyssinicae TaxID=1209958 RepID=A0ABU5AS56_9HYPH|nr:hypothetical protein [Mesorhizobium abyssinicae]MDX8540115.1 hypothetical protein [Mesorhizobium abyssinicae]
MNVRDRWRQHLPDFDPFSTTRLEQRRTSNAVRRLSRDHPAMGYDHLPMRNCSEVSPCRGGLCPRCVRQLRINLLDFLAANGLHRRSWHFVTVRVAGWTKAPGDCKPFGRLRNQRPVLALMAKFRRMGINNLLIFGSIETVYTTVSNVPAGKPFHLHLMISGASEEEISEAVNTSLRLDMKVPRPYEIQSVLMTEEDFFRAASYAFKQPLAKKSKASPDDYGVRQFLNPAERRELIRNYGVHGWRGRLILFGMRCENGPFRLIADLSATAKSALSSSSRKQPFRQQRQPPRGQG